MDPQAKILVHEEIEVPHMVFEKWQELLNLLADLTNVPVALIMKVRPPYIEVFASSKTKNNPYEKGASEKLPGLYCETVIKKDKQLLVPNALKDEDWQDNPDVELNMISYLGLPLKWPDGKFFGTICLLDSKENPYNKKINKLLKIFKELVEFHLDLIMRAYQQDLQIKDYEKLQKFLIGRETKITELKEQIKELEKKQ